MSDIFLYVGLPGSGKTYHAMRECDVVIDDITDLSQLPELETLQERSMGITDVNFCDGCILKRAISTLENMYPKKKVNVIYFENDFGKCLSNVDFRNDGRNVNGTLMRFQQLYDPPKNARKIWTNNESTFLSN